MEESDLRDCSLSMLRTIVAFPEIRLGCPELLLHLLRSINQTLIVKTIFLPLERRWQRILLQIPIQYIGSVLHHIRTPVPKDFDFFKIKISPVYGILSHTLALGAVLNWRKIGQAIGCSKNFSCPKTIVVRFLLHCEITKVGFYDPVGRFLKGDKINLYL